MEHSERFDVIIVGAGLAGLSLSILLAKKKVKVLLIERKHFPFHKVCGEYVSLESKPFLERLGVPLSSMDLPIINELLLSSPKGNALISPLSLGGFGISRFVLEEKLYTEAMMQDVTVLTSCIAYDYDMREKDVMVRTSSGNFIGKVLCASFGKYAFGNFYKSAATSENWVGVKYHIEYPIPRHQIALHNFKGGYAGISAIEGAKSCLCYLVKASVLKQQQQSIANLEKNVLQRNPFLQDIFSKAIFLFDKPLSISNVTFSAKKPVHHHVFYLGDSAGTITPLCGNGMSMALRSSFLLSDLLIDYLQQTISREVLESRYKALWKQHFYQRIQNGKRIQHFFCKESITPLSISALKLFPFIHQKIIRSTHGDFF
jgi:2-polyprenyl-6-methoxyphenol hydroxylase-like FAD-dependent oxidoreductase